MKRKVLSVLGVFMSVLISTAALAGCEKTPAEADGGSGESGTQSESYDECAKELTAQIHGNAAAGNHPAQRRGQRGLHVQLPGTDLPGAGLPHRAVGVHPARLHRPRRIPDAGGRVLHLHRHGAPCAGQLGIVHQHDPLHRVQPHAGHALQNAGPGGQLCRI